MYQPTATATTTNLRWALSGVFFVLFFFAGDILSGSLALSRVPMPGAPASDVARYFVENPVAALSVSTGQILSAAALFVFVWIVGGVVAQLPGVSSQLLILTRVAGVLAATFLLACAVCGLALVALAPAGNLDLIALLRSLNFLFGGTLHVASLGLFVGAASLAARPRKALPLWISVLGIVIGVVAVSSLLSLLVFEAAVLILLGRMLGFFWSIATGLLLAFGKSGERLAGGGRHVLAQ